MLKVPFSLVHTCHANANAKARCTCELHQRKCKRKRKHQRKKWKRFLSLALRLQFTRVNRGNANADAKKGLTTAQWSSRTDLWSMGNQTPTRDLIIRPAAKCFWGTSTRLIHYSKFDIISENDFEGEIMIVKTKTPTSYIQTQRSAWVFLS